MGSDTELVQLSYSSALQIACWWVTNLLIHMRDKKSMHRDRAIRFSLTDGEKNSRKPLSIIKTGKLETQNGMTKNLRICHLFEAFIMPLSEQKELMFNASPTRRAIPSERRHNSRSDSK